MASDRYSGSYNSPLGPGTRLMVIDERSALLRARFGLRVGSIEPVGDGWDSDTYEVDHEWIVRFPRRPAVEERMRAEIGLLGVLRERLSTPVPRPELVSRDPVLVGYRKLAGRALESPVPRSLAGDVARFLSDLHAVPFESVPLPSDDWRAGLDELIEEFRRDVMPLLDATERPRAEAMFAAYDGDESNFAVRSAVVHADLGPEHLLSDGERLTGVIDWSDAMIGDPAIDLAWLLHGAGEEFAAELSACLDVGLDDSLRRRALFFHRLGPWHEVTYGLSVGGPDLVRSGLEGVRDRLPPD